MTNSLYNGTSWNIFYIQFRQFNIYSSSKLNVVITNTFSINLHDFVYENEYCGKTKNLTPEIFLYVLDKIFIVNLKKKKLFLEIHFL